MKKTIVALLAVLLVMAAPAHAATAVKVTPAFTMLATRAAMQPIQPQQPMPVVASFSILGDMVKQIGGDAVSVKTLVGADGDTHVYQPTPDDAKAVTAARLVFVNGLGFEGWMKRLAESTKAKSKVITVSAGVAQRGDDPHAWQDVANGRIYARNIARMLEIAIPTKAAVIKERAVKYDAELAAMDQKIKKEFAALPEAQRKIITSHDAFGYFGAAYGVTFLAPEGLSTESEPSASGVAKLIAQMKAEKVKQVFLENMGNPKLIKQIAKDTGAEIGGTLYSDALSAPNGAAPTYLKMFDNNVPKLKVAMLQNGR